MLTTIIKTPARTAVTAGALAALMLAGASFAQPPAATPAGSARGAVVTGPGAPVDPATITNLPSGATWPAPTDITHRQVVIFSQGVRLHGEVFTTKTASANVKLPTVIMAHGWGGDISSLRQDAVEVARAGYLVLLFDFRGWGESEGRVVLTQPHAPRRGGAATFTAEVKELRGYIDPFEQSDDWFAAIDWAMGEPQIDPTRIGIRGTSYSGGHVIYVAANDPRVKAVVSQVGGMDSRVGGTPPGTPPGQSQGTKLARGEIDYPAPRTPFRYDSPTIPGTVNNLTGYPIQRHMDRYVPVDEAGKITQPTLILLTEVEQYNKNELNGGLAYERIKGPKEIHTYPAPASHYSIYQNANAGPGGVREDVIKRTIAWFDRYLKPTR